MTDLVSIVNAFYDASAVGDFDAAEAMMTDDFQITEAENLPFGGVYKGKSALRNLFAKVMAMMSVAELKHSHMMVGENSVCCVVDMIMADGGEPIQLLEMFVFRGDKVCEIRPFYFNAIAVAAKCA